MATLPEPAPDTIDPVSPAEAPPLPGDNPPSYAPDEAPDVGPDTYEPGGAPDEAPTLA